MGQWRGKAPPAAVVTSTLIPLAPLLYSPNSESTSNSPLKTGPSLQTLNPCGSMQHAPHTPMAHLKYLCRLNSARSCAPASRSISNTRAIIITGTHFFVTSIKFLESMIGDFHFDDILHKIVGIDILIKGRYKLYVPFS